MSQKNSSKAPVSRVSSGIPWWVWVIGAGFVVVLLVITIPRLFPTNPQEAFDEAMVILESQTPNVAKLTENVETLRAYPEWAGHVKYLEARMDVGRNMPLKAIPRLVEAMKSEQIRGKAGLLLGRAYGTAGKFEDAINTLAMVLDDPEVGDEARFISASILTNGLALNDAMEHIKVLKEKGYKPPQVYQQEGDILMDFGRYEEAAAAYKKSLDESEETAAVGDVADRYLQCLVKIGKVTEADQYVDKVEDPTRSSKFQALSLLGKGKVTEALTVLDSNRQQMPLVGEGAVVAAKVSLAENNVEKIKTDLPSVIAAAKQMSRNKDVYETLAQMADKIGNEPLANSARKNAEQVGEIEAEMYKAVAAIAGTRKDNAGRLKVASLAIQCGQYDFAKRVLDSLTRFFPDAEKEANSIMPNLFVISQPLVPLEGLTESDTAPAPVNPTRQGPNPGEAKPEEAKPDEAKPEEGKSEAQPQDAPKTEEPKTEEPK